MDILIIDDQPVYREGLSVILARSLQSCRVVSACDTRNGVKALSAPEVDFNLLLLGINVGSSAAVNQLEELIRFNKNIAIIVLVASIDCKQYIECLKLGVRGVIPKLYSTDKMVAAILECYKGVIHIPPDVQAAINQHTKKHLVRNKVTTDLHLTKRQLQVLELIEHRLTNDEIAEMLSVSLATVKTHINNLYSALDVNGRKECIKRSYDLGVLYLEAKV